MHTSLRLVCGALWALAAVGCADDAPSLQLLITAPAGAAPDALELRVYDDGGLLKQQRFAHAPLPAALRLAQLPAQPSRLRVIAAGLDGAESVRWLAGGSVTLPLTASRLSLALAGDFADADGDGVPDALDDCPAVADPDQYSSVGFGRGPGTACTQSAPPPPDMTMIVRTSPSLCGATPLLVCDALDAFNPNESLEQLLGDATFDQTRSFRGTGSLHLSAPPKGDLIIGAVIPTPDVYLRAFVYLPSPMPTNRFTFLRLQQDQSPFGSLDLQVAAGSLRLRSSRAQTMLSSTVAPPLDRWFCVQWQVHIDPQGFVSVQLDGAPVAGLQPENAFDTSSTPGYLWTVLALEPTDSTGTQPARDLWIDEIAVDAHPIGCAQ